MPPRAEDIRVTVTLLVPLSVARRGETVASVKQKLQRVHPGLEVERQRLCFAGHELKDHTVLEEAQVHDGSTLFLVVRPRTFAAVAPCSSSSSSSSSSATSAAKAPPRAAAPVQTTKTTSTTTAKRHVSAGGKSKECQFGLRCRKAKCRFTHPASWFGGAILCSGWKHDGSSRSAKAAVKAAVRSQMREAAAAAGGVLAPTAESKDGLAHWAPATTKAFSRSALWDPRWRDDPVCRRCCAALKKEKRAMAAAAAVVQDDLAPLGRPAALDEACSSGSTAASLLTAVADEIPMESELGPVESAVQEEKKEEEKKKEEEEEEEEEEAAGWFLIGWLFLMLLLRAGPLLLSALLHSEQHVDKEDGRGQQDDEQQQD